ncbi:hypothetical protein IKF12_02725 [Candidatus Saccharibacteria bacterium]|nr:hypothetical protein [Candidatus Saccharibacteria bacterium]
MRKVILIVLMFCLAICSVSFKGAEAVSMNEPVKRGGPFTETVVIPEIELPQWTDEEIQTVILMSITENPIEEKDPKQNLEWIKENLYLYYTDEEIRLTTLIVQAEDLIAWSDTIWSAHVWVILGRVGAPGFGANSIIEVLSKPGQFSTWCTKCLLAEPNPEVEEIVRDVFARKILEDMGAPEWEVGRTVPATHLFFDNRNGDLYNEFYRYCWGDCYDPFQAPYNPYSN